MNDVDVRVILLMLTSRERRHKFLEKKTIMRQRQMRMENAIGLHHGHGHVHGRYLALDQILSQVEMIL
jgi:hypothetical protein